MQFTDSHAHLYAKAFDEDRTQVIQSLQNEGVGKVLLPNVDAETWPLLLELCKQHPTICYPMAGWHPCDIPEGEDALEHGLGLVTKWLAEAIETGTPCVAVGEIGIDLYWRKDNLEAQRHAFDFQCKLASSKGLPVSIHARDATSEVLQVLDNLGVERPKGVLHCFVGTLAEAHRTVDLGMYLGVGGVATYKNGGVTPVLKQLFAERPEAREQWMLETDSPYLAPIPHRGKRNSSAYIPLIASHLSKELGIPLEEISETTERAVQALFFADESSRP